MKRFLAMVLTLAMLLSMVPAMGILASAETATEQADIVPFYGMGWSDINRRKFSNLEGLATISVVAAEDGTVSLSFNGKTDLDAMAASLKSILNDYPEGMRYIFLFGTAKALAAGAESVIYAEPGMDQLKTQFSALLQKYAALGGKLDGVALDTEYHAMQSWYLYSEEYYPEKDKNDNPIEDPNTEIYNEIVAHEKYATDVRPMLEERGFVFYQNVNTAEGGVKSEIYSIWPYTYLTDSNKAQYKNSASVWNQVMSIRLSQYLNDAVYAPLKEYYPEAILSDYQTDDSYAWLKGLADDGGKIGNGIKVGNASNYNTYSSRPSDAFFVDSKGNYLYQNPAAYNKAEYEDDPYNMFLWDTNKFKNMYAATDTKQINAWIAEYDYNSDAGSVSNTPYYTETILHLGMLDPEPFLIYIYRSAFASEDEYNARMKVISEILAELTRVAGYSDRKPIETPASWNDGFVLSGMYTGGRNLWRLTPDTTDGTTLAEFKVKDEAPTFTINGATITFPQGRIIEDGTISVVGTCGYWIETPEDVTPVITYDADRYSENPSFAEDFSGYEEGSTFTSDTALPAQTWEVEFFEDLLVQNGALALYGTATVNNVKLPANITAGDSYAKQQAWEISFTLSEDLIEGSGSVNLLTCGDGGFKLEADEKGGKVYYEVNGFYNELMADTLTAGEKYTLKREVNFTASNAYTSTYSIYNARGSLIGQTDAVAMATVSLPVESIGISCTDLAITVLVDDYKLYPTGVAQDLEVYDAATGIKLTAEKNDAASVAYRLSWMNASAEGKKVNVKVAYYDSTGDVASKAVLTTVEMAPGADGVVTGIVENTSAAVKVYLEDAGTYTPSTAPEDGDFDWTASVPTVAPTEPTVEPTTPTFTAPTPTDPTTDSTVTEPEEGASVSVGILSWSTMTAKYGGDPVYLKNSSYQGYTSTGVANGTGWTQVKGFADDWNLKFEWPVGGIPTLTLKDAKLDCIGDNGATLYTASTNADTGEDVYTSKGTLSAIIAKSGSANITDLKIVLLGDNWVEVNNGIVRGNADNDDTVQHFKNVTIVGENGGKLSGTGKGIGISTASGYDLTIENATLDLTTTTVGGGTPVPIRTENGDLTIRNSTITCGNAVNVAIAAMTSGDIDIFRSTINVTSKLTSTAGAGAIHADGGTVTISGNSKITAVGENNSCIYGANGVYINGGELNLTSGNEAITAGSGDIVINAGITEITAARNAFTKVPVLAEDIIGYAGVDADNADYYNETKYGEKYVQLIGHVHTEVEMPAVEETCTTAGRAAGGIMCSTCGEVQLEQVIPSTGHDYAAATCTAPATCKDCGVTSGEALGHSEVDVPGKAATCSSTGLTAGKKCENCGVFTVIREEIPKLAHTEEVIAGVAVTDTTNGLTEGKKCTVCGEITVAQEVIPATGVLTEGIRLMHDSIDALASTDGKSTYLINKKVTLTDSGGAEFTATIWSVIANQTTEEPAEWNLKFEYPAGGIPTLYLKGARMDLLNEATGNYDKSLKATMYAINGKKYGDVGDLKIVILEDSYIATNSNVFHDSGYFNDVYIESRNGATLKAEGLKGITVTTGDLYVNANLDIFMPKYNGNFYPLNATAADGDIIINGGNITLTSKRTTYTEGSNYNGGVQWSGPCPSSIRTSGATGDITINGGTLNLTGTYSSSTGAGIIQTAGTDGASGVITINGGNININHGVVSAFYSLNTTVINGGTIYATGSNYCLNKTNGYVQMNGGSLTMYRSSGSAMYGTSYLTLAEDFCCVIKKGTSAETATVQTAVANGNYVSVTTHTLTEVAEVAPTYNTEGTIRHWNCSACGKNFADAAATKEVTDLVIPAAHDWADADCENARTCKVCGATEGEALGHTIEILPGYGKTCTTDGLTEGQKCTVCGETLVEQEEIPALGHTEEVVASKPASCTTTGLTDGVKCSVCGETLTAQTEIPATGHSYDDDSDTTCNNCGEARIEIVIDENKVTVNADGMEDSVQRLYIFYVGSQEDATGIDLSKWSTVKTAAANVTDSPYGTVGYKAYSNPVGKGNIVIADKGGVYVVFVTYTDANGKTKQISKAVTTKDIVKPEITVDGNKVAVGADSTEIDVRTLYIFYVGSQEDAASINLSKWSAVKTAAANVADSPYGTAGFTTYSNPMGRDNMVLADKSGVYVVFVTYTDANGETKQVSTAIDYIVIPKITVDGNKVTVAAKSEENDVQRLYIFYVGSQEDAASINLNKWSVVKTAAANVADSPYGTAGFTTYSDPMGSDNMVLADKSGVYVVFVTYTNANGETKQVSTAVTISNIIKPEITVDEKKVTVDAKSTENDVQKVYIFYVGSQEDAASINLSKWSAVKTAAANVADSPYGTAGFTTYFDPMGSDNMVLADQGGVYVVFVTYTDANGATKQISTSATISGVAKPEIIVDGNKVTVDAKSTENDVQRLYIFYVGSQEDAAGINLSRWSAVKTAAANVTDSPYGTVGYKAYSDPMGSDNMVLADKSGVYVVFVTYADANGATKQVSTAVTVE